MSKLYIPNQILNIETLVWLLRLGCGKEQNATLQLNQRDVSGDYCCHLLEHTGHLVAADHLKLSEIKVAKDKMINNIYVTICTCTCRTLAHTLYYSKSISKKHIPQQKHKAGNC